MSKITQTNLTINGINVLFSNNTADHGLAVTEEIFISTRQLALALDVKHENIMKRVRREIDAVAVLLEAPSSTTSPKFLPFAHLTVYKDVQGKERPMYLLNKQ